MDQASPNWFTLLQSAGIILSFLIAAYAAMRDVKSRKLANYLQLIEYHRDVWRMTLEHEDLADLWNRNPEAIQKKISQKEARFLTFVFLHITCSFELQKSNSLVKIERLEYDIKNLLLNPRVRRFWEENKRFYNRDFTTFIENCIPNTGGY